MTRLRPSALPLALLLLAAAGWGLALRPRPQAPWLRMEASPRAVAGGDFAVRVALSAPEPGSWLVVDLHRAGAQGAPGGFLAGARPRRVAAETSRYEVAVPVPQDVEAQRVEAVVFLSPSGRWEQRTHAAVSEGIPLVRPRPDADEGARLRPIAVYEPEAPRSARPPAPGWRAATVAGWLLAGLVVRRRSGALALACAAAGLWQLANADAVLAERIRTIAGELRWYDERRALQRLASIAAVGATAALAALSVRAGGAPLGALRAALWTYAGISLAQLLSLHELDRALATPVAAVPLVDGARLATALAAVVVALHGARSGAVVGTGGAR